VGAVEGSTGVAVACGSGNQGAQEQRPGSSGSQHRSVLTPFGALGE
jgi:hypothetical protein